MRSRTELLPRTLCNGSWSEIVKRIAPIAAECRGPRRGLGRLFKTAVIVTLLGGGWFAYHAVEFLVPASVVEALLPRL